MSLQIPLLLCLTLGIISSSCKGPTELPPSAGSASNSSKHFSSYENWDFGEKAYQHTATIVGFGPRPIESKAHQQTQDYISSKLKSYGWTVTQQRFSTDTPYGARKFTNHIARYQKQSKNSPEILLAAHYDSKLLGDNFVGADDAASCVGALLEIAEHLPTTDPELAGKIELVFFDGEEALKKDIKPRKDGLYGSLYYSNYLNRDVTSTKSSYKQRPKFGVLLDMIGHKDLSIKIPSDTPYGLMKSYFRVVEKHQLEDRFGVAPYPITDDHLFMNEVAKVPTIDIIGDFANAKNRWWHTNKDNLSLISKSSLKTSIQVALELINDYRKQ